MPYPYALDHKRLVEGCLVADCSRLCHFTHTRRALCCLVSMLIQDQTQQDLERRQALPQQQEQQQLEAVVRQSSMAAPAKVEGSSRTTAILAAVKVEAALQAAFVQSCGTRTWQEQQQGVAGDATQVPPLGIAAAKLLQDHLNAKLLPGRLNEEQLQYYRLADKPFSAAELVQLHSSYLTPKTVRTVQADSGAANSTTDSSSSSRVLRHARKSTRAEQQFPRLAPGLLRLRDAVYVFKHTTSTAGIPSSAVPQNAATRQLLLALRCLQDWEGRMLQHQEAPKLLQLLLLGKLLGGGGEGEVVEAVDLAAADTREQELQRQQQLFEEIGADCMVVHVKEGQAAMQGSAAAGDAVAGGQALAAIKRERGA